MTENKIPMEPGFKEAVDLAFPWRAGPSPAGAEVLTPDCQWDKPWEDSATWSEIAAEVYENAVMHGFWTDEKNLGESIALQASEITEAYHDSLGISPAWALESGWRVTSWSDILGESMMAEPSKPVGEASELVDVIIRCLDLMHRICIDTAPALDGLVDALMAQAFERFGPVERSIYGVPSLLDLHALASESVERSRKSGFRVTGQEGVSPAAVNDFLSSQADLIVASFSLLVSKCSGRDREGAAKMMIQIKHAYNVGRPYLHGKVF